MRIDHLTIKNFNGFDLREFDFNPAFNLLVGDNASGKTSVLDALSVAVGSWFIGLRGYAFPPGITPQEVRIVAHPYQDVYTFEKQFPSRIEARGLVMEKGLAWTRELSREGGRTRSPDVKGISDAASEAERRVRAGEDITLHSYAPTVLRDYGSRPAIENERKRMVLNLHCLLGSTVTVTVSTLRSRNRRCSPGFGPRSLPARSVEKKRLRTG